MVTKFFNKAADSQGGQLYWPSNIADQFDYLEMEILHFSQRNQLVRDRSARGGIIPSPVPAAGASSSVAGQSVPTAEPRQSSTTTLKSKGKILLPVPDNVSYTDSPQWSDQSVGAIGRFGAQAIAEMMGGKTGEAAEAIQMAAEVGKVDIIKNALNRIGVDPNALSQNIAGRIANPYLQQVFQGVGMRQFDFNWKLVPRNEKEQQSIHRIIKTLRTAVLPGFSNDFSDIESTNNIGNLLSPNLGGTTDASGNPITEENRSGFFGKQDVNRWLTLPNIFNLRWKYEGGEIDSLPKLKQCVCKNIAVQYTPDGVWATRLMNGTPQPIAYNLTMSFGEMEIVTNSDVATEGF